MSENKKYFYLKLKDSFFSSEEMLVLESVPDGMIYQNIYLRMCLLSLKNEGALTFKNMLPYDLKMLATVLRVDIAQMKMALELFEQLGLVTKTDNEVLFMSDIQALIGQSSTEAERIARYRKRIADSNNVTEMLPDNECTKSVQMLQTCTPKIELEKEKELKKDIELEGETTTRFHKPSISEIQQYCEERKNTVNAEKFFNHYESNGWYVGKNKMKDWKACIRTWEQNEKKYAISQNGGYVNNKRPASDNNVGEIPF